MATRAEVIDAYFESEDYYPHIPYQPIGEIIVQEVEKMGPDGLYVSTAAALVEKESGGKNVFGCDWGSQWTDVPPYCNVAVTKERVEALIANYHSPPPGVGANGVGYTQLTTMSLVEEAQRLGGAHRPGPNMRVGFRFLNDLVAQFGWPAGAAAYNAGPGNWQSVIDTYGADMAAKERECASRLEGASDVTQEKPAIENIETGAQRKAWSWPAANDPPIVSPIYQLRHPTRYVWRPDVEKIARKLVDTFNVSCNTYHEHPEGRGFEVASTDPDGKVWRIENTSLDVWGPQGRNDPIGSTVGQQIFELLLNDPNKPDINWIIWQATQYGAWNSWQGEPFGTNPFTWHYDHIHVTYR